MRFIFLTKTKWSEPPRIRHQLARMLSNAGYEIIFFEKPIQFFGINYSDKINSDKINSDNNIIHHILQPVEIN